MALFEYLWLLHGRYQKCHWQIYNAPSLFVSLFYVWIKIKKNVHDVIQYFLGRK